MATPRSRSPSAASAGAAFPTCSSRCLDSKLSCLSSATHVTLILQLLVHPGPVISFARRVSIATSTHVAASHLCCIYACSYTSNVLGCRYVEQDDIHSPQTTVREALSFSGHLRLPKDQSKRDVEAFVDQVRLVV